MLVGISAGIRGVQDELGHIADAASSVLLTGEHGVGKSLVARLIHDGSARSSGPFIAASCANLSDDARENLLFGAEYGRRAASCYVNGGWLESADGGTLFLDDVGEMGLGTQEVLLRFLDKGQQQRVPPQRRPDRRIPPLSLRLIAATPRNLLEAVKQGSFLEHLYYRLNVVHIQIPALRERREDVPVLMEHYLRVSADEHKRAVPKPTDEAMALLMRYTWPGNVSELRAVADWLVLQDAAQIDVAALPGAIGGTGLTPPPLTAPGRARTIRAALLARVIEGTDDFWSAVYEPFMQRELSRTDVRAIVLAALEGSGGGFKTLAERMKVQPRDYKRFDAFLRKCGCEVTLAPLKAVPTTAAVRAIRPPRATA